MVYIEVAVNVPIRRGAQQVEVAPPAPETSDEPTFQTFHYHLPPDLEGIVAPGHLIWAPFGHQQLQGVVLRTTETAPVPTKAILRLARPEPVLSPTQIELAEWIATYYVATLTEAIKLFFPPGLLTRNDGTTAARAKRELKVSLGLPAALARAEATKLARPSKRAAIVAHLLAQPGAVAWADLRHAVGISSRDRLHELADEHIVAVADDQITLELPPAQAHAYLQALQGVDKYLAVVDALVDAGGVMWRSELYALTPADLTLLRTLQKSGIVTLSEEVRMRDPLGGRNYRPTTAPPLTSEQATVWRSIHDELEHSIAGSPPKPFLLHGVTGSGKTEIYLRAIAEMLASNRQAIVLVPEIALTPQTVARFAGRFPGRVTVIHSELSAGERYDVWRSVRDGAYDVVIGPRSALFAPLPRLGLIIIDEEHESTYKQDAEEWGSFNVFYDARRVAMRLAELTDSMLILGSATPSLDSYFAAEQGQMTLLSMPRRVLGHQLAGQDTQYAELPPVEIVDMRHELRAGNRSIFSRSLIGELHATLDAGAQAILFLNRRGTHTFVICRDCGHVEECKRCETPLTYHEGLSQLVCHHCNRHYPIPTVCPVCHSKRIKYFGSGTERIEEAIREVVPRAQVLRWDADTTARKGAHEAIMQRFAAHEADILVGTQMIAKGLDLPLVTLVGVIAADIGLFLPDFRSGERTFQLLTQVAGRAGRSERGGRVVIQSYRPEHHAIQAAARHDYLAFYNREMAFRREQAYPPVRRLARLIYWHKNADKAKQAAEEMALAVRSQMAQLGLVAQTGEVLGPAPAFFERFRGYYRWQILVRAPDPALLLRGLNIPFGWRVDVDPVSVL